MELSIESYRESPASSYEIATFDIYWPEIGLTFKKIKLIKNKKGAYFLGYPSYCVDDGAGSKTWIPYFDFSENSGKEFRKVVMQELKNFVPDL